VEGGNLPQTRFSHHCTKTAGNFLERFRDFSYILATEPQKRICYCPPNFGGNKGPPGGEKLVSSVTRVGVPQMEKNLTDVFMCRQESSSSAGANWK